MMKKYFIFISILFSILFNFAKAGNDFATQPSLSSLLASKNLLIDITVVDNHIITVGERGHILYSDDVGKSWKQAEVPISANLTAVFFIDATHGWAVGHDATILHTSDGGKHWELQHTDPAGEVPLLNVTFKNSTTGYAIGAYGLFLETTDGGNHWQDSADKLDNPNGLHLYDLIVAEKDTLFIVGEAGLVFRSMDSGDTWETVTFPYKGSLFGGFYSTQHHELVVFGLRGHIFTSKDLGNTWVEIPPQTSVSLMGGKELSDGNYLFVGNSGVILKTSGKFDTLTTYIEEERMALSSVIEVDNTLLLVGQNGVHLRDIKKLAESTHE